MILRYIDIPNENFVFKGYKWLLSQNQPVRNDFFGHTRN